MFFIFYVKSRQIPGPFLSPGPSDELCFLWIILIDVYIPPPRLNVDIINIQGVLESGHLLELVEITPLIHSLKKTKKRKTLLKIQTTLYHKSCHGSKLPDGFYLA